MQGNKNGHCGDGDEDLSGSGVSAEEHPSPRKRSSAYREERSHNPGGRTRSQNERRGHCDERG